MATIQNVRTTTNPQRAYQFEVEILGSTVSGNLPLLTQRVRNANIPETSTETIEVNFKDSKTLYSGRDASGHTTVVTFWDDEDGSVYKFFKEWKTNGIRNPIIGGGLSRDLIAAEMRIKMFANDSQTVTRIVRLTNVWPTSIGEAALTYESSENLSFDITFNYDEVILEQ